MVSLRSRKVKPVDAVSDEEPDAVLSALLRSPAFPSLTLYVGDLEFNSDDEPQKKKPRKSAPKKPRTSGTAPTGDPIKRTRLLSRLGHIKDLPVEAVVLIRKPLQ